MTTRSRKRLTFSLLSAALLLAAAALTRSLQLREAKGAVPPQGGRKSVEDRVREYGAAVDARLKPLFAARGVAYPPAKLTLITLKDERVLEVYAANARGPWRFITSYAVLAASGVSGPKLREGDLQVPEGLYRISLLNPNSLYHLSLRVNYPNEFDRRMAARDNRQQLGGDIMIHGRNVSVGCVAVGDRGAEDLFILAARTGLERISVILSPTDLRKHPAPAAATGQSPAWLGELYAIIARELSQYPSRSDVAR